MKMITKAMVCTRKGTQTGNNYGLISILKSCNVINKVGSSNYRKSIVLRRTYLKTQDLTFPTKFI